MSTTALRRKIPELPDMYSFGSYQTKLGSSGRILNNFSYPLSAYAGCSWQKLVMIWEENSAGPITRRESAETTSIGRGD